MDDKLLFNCLFVNNCLTVSFDLSDAEWYDNVDDAKDDALDWSVELNGENVVVYEALDAGEDGYDFKPLSSVFA